MSMKKIKAIVVDDELGARQSLSNILNSYCPEIDLLDSVDSVATAYESINKYGPEMVFLDIEMPNENAFDLLNKFETINFQIIFTTAYDHHAITAIKFSAFDYLLKPIDVEDLKESISRYTKSTVNAPSKEQHEALLSNVRSTQGKKLAVADMESMTFVKIADIIRLESDGNYTSIKMEADKSIMASKTLGDFEELLETEGFFRTHRKHIINIQKVDKYIKGEGGYVILTDGSHVEVSRRKKNTFLQALAKL